MHLVVVCLIGASKATNLYKEEIILVLQKRSECDPFYIFTQLKFNDSLSKERKLLLQEISMKTQKKGIEKTATLCYSFFSNLRVFAPVCSVDCCPFSLLSLLLHTSQHKS